MTLPISYFRFYFPEYVLKTRLPPNCATGFLDSLTGGPANGRASCQAVEKVEHSWAFSHLYGKISMGDERCLNEGSWIVES